MRTNRDDIMNTCLYDFLVKMNRELRAKDDTICIFDCFSPNWVTCRGQNDGKTPTCEDCISRWLNKPSQGLTFY